MYGLCTDAVDCLHLTLLENLDYCLFADLLV